MATEHSYRRGTRARLVAFVVFVVALAGVVPAAVAQIPAPSTMDIGAPALVGATSVVNNALVVDGAGKGIGGYSDQFRIVFYQVSGDQDVVARLAAFQSAPATARAGILIRQNLTASAASAALLVSPAGAVSLNTRMGAGGAGVNLVTRSGSAPVWLKLARRGTTVTAQTSPNGVNWTTVGMLQFRISEPFVVGLAVTSGDALKLARASFDNVSLVSNWPPQVTMTAPQTPAGGTIKQAAGSTLELAATASDPNGQIAKVDFFAGTTLLASDATAPYAFTWANLPVGTHQLSVVARDSTGATATAMGPVVSVAKGGAPTVALTSPADASTFAVKAPIVLAASASDADGTVVKVNFYSGVKLLGSATASPFTMTWTDAAAGVHVLTATAIDNSGQMTASVSRTVTVKANGAPVVALTAPLNGSTVFLPEGVTMAATASDSDGTIAKVDFYAGATLIGSSTAAPFTFTWLNAPAGIHSLTAVATDNSGATATSATSSVTVKANTAPTVSLTAPIPNATFTAPVTVTVTATAVDTDGTVAKVDFYAGATLIGSDSASPYLVSWANAPAGTHTLTAVATDNRGTTTTSSPVSITVKGNVAPTVSLTGPDMTAAAIAPATVQLSAIAADSDGSVAKVAFYAGSTLLGTRTASPYAITWTNAPAGTHVLTAVATDDRGAVTTSASRTLTVKNNAAPTVALAAPAAAASFASGAPVTISATAADSDGTVASVSFYAGATLVGSTTVSPYTVTWNNAPLGTHVLTAVAKDDRGATTTSASRTITVKANAAPTVSLTSPEANASFLPPATVAVSASAADTDGTVSKVAFYAGATLVGTATASPYTVTWANVAAGTYVLTSVATDDRGATTTSASRTITVKANDAPVVSWTLPANDAKFASPASIAMTVTATDADGSIAKVEFFSGATLIGTATASPYTATWANVPNGAYVLTAIATDNRGATKSATRTVTVADNAAPSVSLTSPAAAAKFTMPAAITVSASATDADGTIAKVEFYAGSTLVGSDSASPYSIVWSGAAEGTHSLTAVAYDNKGGMTVSSAREVLVTASSLPDTLMFTPAIGSTIDNYVMEVFTAGADAATATPVTTLQLGRPAVVNNEIVVDVRQVLYPLPAGDYFAVVTASTGDGLLRSPASAVFTR